MWNEFSFPISGTTGKVMVAPASRTGLDGVVLCSAHDDVSRFLLLSGNEESPVFKAFDGQCTGNVKKAPYTHDNAEALRKYFPWTKPVPVLRNYCSFGCGDRIGFATSAHAALFREYNVSPVFAQQSVRELTLTHRTFESVIDDASFEVFQTDYENGFGADGDHLKSFEHIGEALKAGVTMLTLDLSEQLQPQYAEADEATVTVAYADLPASLRERIERDYNDVPALGLHFSPLERMRCALIYTKAMDFTAEVRKFLVEHNGAETDLEISIDETTAPTIPEHHFFVASELKYRNVPFVSLAPRFIGEFQKGIDYIGNITLFERQFAVHARIADYFKTYKLSIHSGSDKFSAFPAIGRLTKGHFHLKTAGTSWLEAAKAIAVLEPALFRKMIKYAFATLADARKLYHVTADFDSLPDPDTIADSKLVDWLAPDCVPGRQLIHITYGSMLGGNDPELTLAIRSALLKNADGYAECIRAHFTKHLTLLGITKKA